MAFFYLLRRVVCSSLVVLGTFSLAAASFTPVPLAESANTGFTDTEEGDKKGGWLDLGGNDLRVLKPGRLTFCKIPFEILDGRQHPDKTCIVLGGPRRPYLPAKAAIQVGEKQGDYLYLLHAAAWCPPAKERKMTGVLTVEYADGEKKDLHVRFGRDVADWAKPESYKNAARAWSQYNANTQVSLFVSKFKLSTKPVKTLRLEAKESAWMVVAVTLGDNVSLKAIKPNLTLDRKYVAPPPFDPPLAADVRDVTPKNIILIIGDGMGSGAHKLTSLYQHKAENRLLMQQLPVTTFCTTLSIYSNVTDSAAASTAIACGQKTRNAVIGLDEKTNKLVSVATLAKQSGRAVAILTSDSITGATPSGFYAHVTNRGAYEDIACFAATCDFDMLLGSAKGKAHFLPKGGGGQRADKRNLVKEMSGRDYVMVETAAAFAQVPQEKRVLGFLDKPSLEPETALSVLMETALSRLAEKEKGFFMMMECTITDAGGHANNPELSVRGTLQVDWAVWKAVEFARKEGNTLVLVTADHETGGITCDFDKSAPGGLRIQYATTDHTEVPVPFFAFGPGSKEFAKTIDNTDIAKTIARFWALKLIEP
jgi:alkaline phosphatase